MAILVQHHQPHINPQVQLIPNTSLPHHKPTSNNITTTLSISNNPHLSHTTRRRRTHMGEDNLQFLTEATQTNPRLLTVPPALDNNLLMVRLLANNNITSKEFSIKTRLEDMGLFLLLRNNINPKAVTNKVESPLHQQAHRQVTDNPSRQAIFLNLGITNMVLPIQGVCSEMHLPRINSNLLTDNHQEDIPSKGEGVGNGQFEARAMRD